MMQILAWFFAAAVAVLAALAAWDIIKNISIQAIPDMNDPTKQQAHKFLECLELNKDPQLAHDLLLYLERPDLRDRDGVVIDDAYVISAVTPAKNVIDRRVDCMDFRMQTLLRLLYAHGETLREISPAGVQRMEDAFLHAKYWMTEPGEDSMCYWSENHQLLFAVAEYLAGRYWPDKIFTNDGATGKEHMARGRARVEHWARQRFLHGFSEFNSSNYYRFNMGPAANFIQFCAPEDRPLAERLKMCLDLLFFDIACYSHKLCYTAPTGRAYVDNMAGETGNKPRAGIAFLWNGGDDSSNDCMWVNFFAMLRARDAGGKPYYEFPQVLKEIANDCSERELKASFGLDTAELPALGYVGHGDAQIMRQMSMEAFTNPEVIHNTITYLAKHNMFSNAFVNYFKIINLRLIKNKPTLTWISRHLNPMPNGIAIQRANFYCWQTKNYTLSSLQKYHPGGFGAQQMLNAANFGGQAVAFTAHPARHEAENTVSAYPGYWAGFGRAPHSAQHKNVLLLLFQVPKKSGFLELYKVPQFTHTYLPEAFFDEVRVEGRYAFARVGEAFLGLSAANELEYLPWSEISAKALKNGLADLPGTRFDLVQRGNRQYWVYELSENSKESFGDFMSRIKSTQIAYTGETLKYANYETSFNGAFKFNGQEIDLQHRRFENPYCVAERDAPEFEIKYGVHSLRMHYDKAERVLS